MEAIILAGGFGTRLAARLDGVPKSLAPVAGHPFLEIVLTQLQRARCTRILLSVGYLHTMIEDYFGASFGGVPLEYVVESEPLGTGGAIRMALERAEDDSALVLNGDTFLEANHADMMRFHSTEGADATIAVVHQPDLARYGGVVIEGDRIVGYEEKGRSGPGWISAGAYVLNRNLEWPPALKGKFSIEKDFFAPEIARLRPAAYKVDGYFLDIGVPEDFDRAQTELARFA